MQGGRRHAVAGLGPRRRSHRRRAGDAALAANRRACGRTRSARRSRRGTRHEPARAGATRPPRRGDRRARARPRGGRLAAAGVADRTVPRLSGVTQRPFRQSLRRHGRRSARTRRGEARHAAGADRSRRPPRRCVDGGSGFGGDRRSAARGGARAIRGPRVKRGRAAPPRAVRGRGRAAVANDPRPVDRRRTVGRGRSRPGAR